MKAMIASSKGLAYSRGAALLTILEILNKEHLPTEEQLDQIKMIVKSTGTKIWEEKNPTE